MSALRQKLGQSEPICHVSCPDDNTQVAKEQGSVSSRERMINYFSRGFVLAIVLTLKDHFSDKCIERWQKFYAEQKKEEMIT